MIHLYSTKFLKKHDATQLPANTFYLGVRYQDYFDVRQNHNSVETLGARFQNKLQEVEKDFLLMMNEYVRLHGQKAWLNPLASRNSSGSPLLRNILYALCAVDLAKEYKDKELAFVCEDVSLIHWLANSFGAEKSQKHLGIWERAVGFKRLLAYARKLISFFVSFNCSWLASRFYLKPLQWCQGATVLRSWVNRDILSGETYRDRNFGELGDFLKENGKNVIYAPLFFNLGRNMFSTVKELSRFDENIVVPEKYVGWFSWITVFFGSFFGFKSGNYRIGEQDIASLVEAVHYDSFFCKSDLENVVFARMLKKVSDSGGNLERYIYTFESNTVEKNTILVVRSLFEECEIIGFQHSVWYKNQLGMKVIPEEIDIHPLPDKIVTSGEKYRKVLTKCGFPENKIQQGPNLRFTAINDLRTSDVSSQLSQAGDYLLIVLNFDINQNMELLEKISDPTRKFNKPIKIKSHPLVNGTDLKNFLGKINFPEYSFVDERVNDLVSGALAVIMPACSVSNLEVLCQGKPLIRVSMDNDFNFDPVWEDGCDFEFCNTSEEVLNQLQSARAVESKNVVSRSIISKDILDTYFAEVTKTRLQSFLNR